MNNPIVILLLVPLTGAAVCALLPGARSAKWLSLCASLLTAGVAGWIALSFNFHADLSGIAAPDRAYHSVQFRLAPDDRSMLRYDQINAGLRLGVDAISLWLVLLTALLMPSAIAASFSSIRQRAKEYYAWMLLLLAAMLGVFVAQDLLLFYICFELTLIPMFFIIGIWGGPERRYAAGKFFLFTFAGSVFTLAGVIYLGLGARTFELSAVINYAQVSLNSTQRLWIFLAMLIGFAVKVPLFPLHTWLPLAHTEAPTAGSVILAGVLLKLGTYGLLRLAVPLGMIGAHGPVFPRILQLLAVLCIIGIIYAALVAWVQQDIKKLVAYSSVSHLGFCVLGLLALNDAGMQGSVLYMVNHGLSTGAMFLVIGMVYERFHTRDISELSGLARKMPVMAFFFVLFSLSSIGLPGLNGFVSEFLTVLGAFTSPHLGIGFGALAATGIILGAVYMLHMVARVIWGPLKVPPHEDLITASGDDPPTPAHAGSRNDLNRREIALLVPIALAVVLLGVLPTPVLDSLLGPVRFIRQPSVAAQADLMHPPASGVLAAAAPADRLPFPPPNPLD